MIGCLFVGPAAAGEGAGTPTKPITLQLVQKDATVVVEVDGVPLPAAIPVDRSGPYFPTATVAVPRGATHLVTIRGEVGAASAWVDPCDLCSAVAQLHAPVVAPVQWTDLDGRPIPGLVVRSTPSVWAVADAQGWGRDDRGAVLILPGGWSVRGFEGPPLRARRVELPDGAEVRCGSSVSAETTAFGRWLPVGDCVATWQERAADGATTPVTRAVHVPPNGPVVVEP